MKIEAANVVGNNRFFRRTEPHTLAEHTIAVLREIVRAQNHVLRRNSDRLTILRRYDIVRRKHEDCALELSFVAERYVHGHLVTVEVGVERRTNERMDLERAAFNQSRLECLNT